MLDRAEKNPQGRKAALRTSVVFDDGAIGAILLQLKATPLSANGVVAVDSNIACIF